MPQKMGMMGLLLPAVLPSQVQRRNNWSKRNEEKKDKAPGPTAFFDDPRQKLYERRFTAYVAERVVPYAQIIQKKLKRMVRIAEIGTGPGNITARIAGLLLHGNPEESYELRGCEWAQPAVDRLVEKVAPIVAASKQERHASLSISIQRKETLAWLKAMKRKRYQPDILLVSRYLLHEDKRHGTIIGDWAYESMRDNPDARVFIFEPLANEDINQSVEKNKFSIRASMYELREMFSDFKLETIEEFPYYGGHEIYSYCLGSPRISGL